MGTMGKSVKYVVVPVLVTVLAACCAGSVMAQESDAAAKGVRQQERDTVASLVAEYEADIRALMDRAVEVGMLDKAGRDSVLMAAGLLPASAFHPRYLPLDVVEDNLKWAASRPLEIDEILARDRRLILSRMIYDSGMPQFLQDLRAQNPAVYSVVAIVMGILGGAGGFLGGSPMEMLVPRPFVGGQPWFDDMIFLDPNFDPSVYYPSLPVPQYDPENPSQQFKAALRGNSGRGDTRSVQVRSIGSSGPAGPPPVQKSRYVIP